jgi:hypothetical protein
MTVIKQFGKVAGEVTFGTTIDSQVHNTCRGNSSGNGFNMPNPDNATWADKFPVPRRYFWGEDTIIKPSSDWAFSSRITAELQYPRISAAAGDATTRSQFETIRNQTRIAFGFSIYVPTRKYIAKNMRRQILQRWGGGSPGFGIYMDFEENSKNWISFRPDSTIPTRGFEIRGLFNNK